MPTHFRFTGMRRGFELGIVLGVIFVAWFLFYNNYFREKTNPNTSVSLRNKIISIALFFLGCIIGTLHGYASPREYIDIPHDSENPQAVENNENQRENMMDGTTSPRTESLVTRNSR